MSSDPDGPSVDRVREQLKRSDPEEDDAPEEPGTGDPDLDRVTEQRDQVEEDDA